MSKKVFFKNLREGRKALADLGVNPGYMSLKEMAVTYEQELKRRASTSAPAKVATTTAAVDPIEALSAAAKAERNPTVKADMLGDLSQRLLTKLNATTDAVKQTNIRREWQNAEKARAYALLAERSVDPKAARARRLLDRASQ